MHLTFHHLYINMKFAAAPLNFISKVWLVGLGHFGLFLSLISEITAPVNISADWYEREKAISRTKPDSDH